jgi:hypothetical protein
MCQIFIPKDFKTSLLTLFGVSLVLWRRKADNEHSNLLFYGPSPLNSQHLHFQFTVASLLKIFVVAIGRKNAGKDPDKLFVLSKNTYKIYNERITNVSSSFFHYVHLFINLYNSTVGSSSLRIHYEEQCAAVEFRYKLTLHFARSCVLVYSLQLLDIVLLYPIGLPEKDCLFIHKSLQLTGVSDRCYILLQG